ncbi:MAG: HK97 family phage prohead protease, partial [Muribaculaceae bacterium]|nr:HK97 family phage prohead protease [Muribaculaceae bacterium]
MNEVVISTSAVNSYGFRVLTEGIDTTQFERNPILLWMHNRPMRGTKDEVLPLGRVENLRKEGDKLIGSLVFDSADEFAKQIESKWQNGIIKMVSAGLEVISTDESPELMLPGQTGTTITKSKLKEVSVVDIGANDDALALYHRGEMLLLSDGNHKNIDFLTIKNTKMKKIAIQLGLAEGATESEILAKVAGIQNENKTLKDAAEKARKDAIVNLVSSAQEAGKFGADKKDHFVKLGMECGFETLKTTLECMC